MTHRFTFTITQAQLLTANQRLHWRQRAERTKHLRQRGAYAQQLDGGRLERLREQVSRFRRSLHEVRRGVNDLPAGNPNGEPPETTRKLTEQVTAR